MARSPVYINSKCHFLVAASHVLLIERNKFLWDVCENHQPRLNCSKSVIESVTIGAESKYRIYLSVSD